MKFKSLLKVIVTIKTMKTAASLYLLFILLCAILIVSETYGSNVNHRVKRGGKGRSARMGSGGGGHSYGVVSMASTGGSGKKTVEVDPLVLILGAKALALKVYVLTQLLTTSTTPRSTVAAG